MGELPPLWDGVLGRLGSELPAFAVETWLRPLAVRDVGGELRLDCPTPFHRDRIRERYLDAIAACAAREAGAPVRITLSVAAGPRGSRTGRSDGAGPDPAPGPAAPEPRSLRPQALAPEAPTDPTPPANDAGQWTLPHTFETFVVGPCNALAREASLAVAHGRHQALSPLCIVSPSGLGKTHLARAVLAEAQRCGATRVRFSSAEQFTSEFMASIRSQRTADFKQRFRQGCDLLVVDDVQFLSNKRSTQLEFFHTIEHLGSAGARIVVTVDQLPKEIPGLDPRLESRLASGLVAEIEPPDAMVRRRILSRKAARGGVRLPEECLERLVETLRGNVRDLESVLIQLVASASLLKRTIDLELTEAALRKVLPQPPASGELEPETVIEVVTSFFRTTPGELASRSRRREVLVPRQIAMYLCRRYTTASLKQIGRALGRDHPSVANAVAGIERRILERPRLRYQVEALSSRLDARRRAAGAPVAQSSSANISR